MKLNTQMKNKAFKKVLNVVGSKSDLAKLSGYSESHIRSILCGARNVPAKAVLKFVELADGKVTAKELRPDIFFL